MDPLSLRRSRGHLITRATNARNRVTVIGIGTPNVRRGRLPPHEGQDAPRGDLCVELLEDLQIASVWRDQDRWIGSPSARVAGLV
jgi:hypothetical protein